MRAPSRVETARLVLSAPMASDALAIFEPYASDPDVTRYVGWPRHGSVAETERFLTFSASKMAATRGGALSDPHPGRRAAGGKYRAQPGLSLARLEKCGFARDPEWSGLAEFPNLAPGVQQPVLVYGRSIERPLTPTPRS